MAFELPRISKLAKARSKWLLIGSGAVACITIAAIYVSSNNKNAYEFANNELVNVNDDIANMPVAATSEIDFIDNLGVRKENEIEKEEKIKKISILRPYPMEIQAASKDLANLRNPFSPPTVLGSAQGIAAPLITIKGFAANINDPNPKAFLNINNSEDNEYQIGQEVGGGYRIVGIEPKNQKIIVSDGINRYDYILKEF